MTETYRDKFISDVTARLKNKIDMASGSMDLKPKELAQFTLGMSCALDAIISLTDDRTVIGAPYRIYPVEYIAVPQMHEPIAMYVPKVADKYNTHESLIDAIWAEVNT